MMRRIATHASSVYTWEKWSIDHEWQDSWQYQQNFNFNWLGGESPYTVRSYGFDSNGRVQESSLDVRTAYNSGYNKSFFWDDYIQNTAEAPYIASYREGTEYYIYRNVENLSGVAYNSFRGEKLVPVNAAIKGSTRYADVTSSDPNAYPDNAEQDGYWYIRKVEAI